jgi:hypothetical protein
MFGEFPVSSVPPSVYYASKGVNNADLKYFIEAFELKQESFRDTYLQQKQVMMGLSYRYSHYSPLDFEKKKKDEIDRILARWEQWFVRNLELVKGVSKLKKEFLIKQQYEVCGLELPESRKSMMFEGYFTLMYQFEISEKDRQDILHSLELIKKDTYGSIPGISEMMNDDIPARDRPLYRVASNMLEAPPRLNCRQITL